MHADTEIDTSDPRAFLHRLWVMVFAAFLISGHAQPTLAKDVSWQGKVIGVADGDTITVLHDRRPVKIRLHGVDCPEKKQPFGQKAKQFTSKLVFGKVVTVKVATTDKYRRTVAEVVIGDRSLNEELVKAGLAWWYRKYARRAKMLAFLEEEARKAKRGLWADPTPTPPWEYRHRGKGLRCNVKSHVCHMAGCQHYHCKNCTARFMSMAEAVKAGYRAHGACVRRAKSTSRSASKSQQP